METTIELDELLVCRLDTREKKPRPCSLVIFGASGDLTSRKLIPALYHLYVEKLLPEPFLLVGVARREKNSESWRNELKEAVAKFSRSGAPNEEQWNRFASKILYCRGDLGEYSTYFELKQLLEAQPEPQLVENTLFYLATAPGQFAEIVENLSRCGLVKKENQDSVWQRVIVEKPFGYSLESARALNRELFKYLHENQLYRIDHYLGKETVQNILMFRFANSIFETLWNRQAIDHFQITTSEKQGVGSRGGYYEEAGALRDMVQNHMLQLLALVAMEPPVTLESESIRDEKVKLLKSIRRLDPDLTPQYAVRGQYIEGEIDGVRVKGYRQEEKVKPDSHVETFVALKLYIDNWRWSGVPFFLRTGKRLPVNASEIRAQFKRTPNVLFAAQCGERLDANSITLRLQPDEGITLKINGKVPGASVVVRPVRMHFSYNTEFGAYTPEAYERLLLDALSGDPTLFIRSDEVEVAWSIVDPIRQFWQNLPLTPQEFYPAGTWGPQAANTLLEKAGFAWRNPAPPNK
ncbi:MAG: glucose-6-phosphate dehydrogenase [Verrucomicrobiia bacterium]